MSAARVLLWRHARTDHNQRGVWQGQLDIGLDDVGRRQAAESAAALATVAAGYDEVRVVSSDLVRARDTAAAFERLTGLVATTDVRLREIYAGAWEGRSREEIVAAGMGQQLDAWLHGEDVPVGGGERRSEVAVRGAAAVAEHSTAMDGGLLVAVSHGGVMRGTVLALLDLPPQRWDLLGGLGNCHWVELEPRGARWRLRAYNVSAWPRASAP